MGGGRTGGPTTPTGLADATVGHISIGTDVDDGVTIDVYPEGDTGVSYVEYDATGRLIRVR